MQKYNIMKNQKGFTLFEILIGAVIFTILAAIIVPQLTAVKDRNVLVTQEVSLMSTTLGNIEDRYFDEVITSANLDNEQLVDGQIIADSYRVNGTSIYNLFGGDIDIVGFNTNGLIWVSEGITEAACVKLIDDVKNLSFDEVLVDGGGPAVDYNNAADAINTNFTAACTPAFVESDTATVTFTRYGIE